MQSADLRVAAFGLQSGRQYLRCSAASKQSDASDSSRSSAASSSAAARPPAPPLAPPMPPMPPPSAAAPPAGDECGAERGRTSVRSSETSTLSEEPSTCATAAICGWQSLRTAPRAGRETREQAADSGGLADSGRGSVQTPRSLLAGLTPHAAPKEAALRSPLAGAACSTKGSGGVLRGNESSDAIGTQPSWSFESSARKRSVATLLRERYHSTCHDAAAEPGSGRQA